MELISCMQAAFPLTKAEIELMIQTAPSRYKVHFIEKRNGRGRRLIAQPTAEIKLVQRWIVDTYLISLPVHKAAMAYRPKIGIKDHAQLHAKNNYLLKLDFEDFFPSILARDFLKHMAQYANLASDDCICLARLLFRRDPATSRMVLSIGAPSSPCISNTIMFTFDSIIGDYCDSIDVRYSRYADDLAFSTNVPHVLDGVKKFVQGTCEKLQYPRLTLNEKKTVFTSKKFQRQLTGLVLANDGKISMGRDKKREIRSMANHYSRGNLSSEETSRLRGLIAFALSVEPQYVESIQRMIGADAYSALMHG